MKRTPLKRGNKRLNRVAKHDKMSLTRLHKKAWDLQSKAIRQEEKLCYTCGAKGDWREAQLGHFRHGKNMDFIRENVHRQCVRCNKFLHGNLGKYAEVLEENYGYGIVQRLNKIADTKRDYKRKEIEEIIQKYGN
ncbi:MAG: recombination protein NinG [Atribacterota bacterium]|nr:recombination protein NinG [Atribacterota bacterium]